MAASGSRSRIRYSRFEKPEKISQKRCDRFACRRVVPRTNPKYGFGVSLVVCEQKWDSSSQTAVGVLEVGDRTFLNCSEEEVRQPLVVAEGHALARRRLGTATSRAFFTPRFRAGKRARCAATDRRGQRVNPGDIGSLATYRVHSVGNDGWRLEIGLPDIQLGDCHVR